MKITRGEVNHLTNPLGYDLESMVFSWMCEDCIGKKTRESRLRIFYEEDCLYDSGWSDLNSLGTEVKLELAPRRRYTWQVQVRTDASEEASSDLYWFETGKLEEEWIGRWIGCEDSEVRMPVFSKEIKTRDRIRSARFYVCGLGLYEAFIDEKRVGEEYLTPYCNDYNSWVQYQTYDVTKEMTEGTHVISVALGNGWYKGRFGFWRGEEPYYADKFRLIGELRLVYEDGTEEVVGTDASWQVVRSNITFNNIYDGEWRDDTLPLTKPCGAVLTDPPAGKLTPRHSTPVCIRKEMPVAEQIQTPAGEMVLDLGQNMTGSFKLYVDAPAGTKVRLQFGEILQQDNFYRDNLRTAKEEYVYISDGRPKWVQPRFTFYGYRYVKVEGLPHLKKEDFVGLVLYSQIPRSGTVSTGNDLVNRLITNTEWGQKGNFLDVPTDCPQRDERMGWTGDAQIFAPTACFQRECFPFFEKYLYDLKMEQKKHKGMVPEVIPSVGDENTSAAWGDAACVIPMVLYQYYGDKSILLKQFESMCGWVDYMQEMDGDDHGWRRSRHYGDWLALDEPLPGEDERKGGTALGYVADAYFYHSALLTAKAAEILGREDKALHYEKLAQRVLCGIREDYFSEDGMPIIHTQTAYLLALHFDLTDQKEKAAEALVQNLLDHDRKLTTGFVGTPLLAEELTKWGRSDLAYDLLLNEEYPGWLYEVKHGATTIWERWNSVLPDGSISDTGMNSLNHYAYGCIVSWLYAYGAGIRQEPGTAGFKKLVLQPHFEKRLGSLCAVYRTGYGEVSLSWKTEGETVLLDVSIPFDTQARLILPEGREEKLNAGRYHYEIRS